MSGKKFEEAIEPFDKFEEAIEKYSNVCIDKNNNVILNKECKDLLLYLQMNILPKSRNMNSTNRKSENKKWLVWDLNPLVRIQQKLILTPFDL